MILVFACKIKRDLKATYCSLNIFCKVKGNTGFGYISFKLYICSFCVEHKMISCTNSTST